MTATSTDLVVPGEFGTLDVLTDIAHGDYVDGLADQAIDECRAWIPVTQLLGDVVTERYLRYVQAVSMLDIGRYSEALETATDLLDRLGDDDEPVWRCKALSVAAEAAIRMDKTSEAIVPLAEADWLLDSIARGTYGYLSAGMALALALRSANLMERADEIMASLISGGDAEREMILAEERAMLSAHWAIVLLLIDRPADAAVQLHATLTRALRTQHWAALAGHRGMVARGLLLEAFGWLYLDQPDLAVARARSALDDYDARPELLETHMLHLVLGHPAAGDPVSARQHLHELLRDAEVVRRGLWEAAGRSALAQLDAQEHGESEGARMWREVARAALRSTWAEREARFSALRGQQSIRRLTAQADRYGQVMLEDPLTGLGNRRMLARLTDGSSLGLHAATGPTSVRSAVFVDVDEFKGVNDRFGHAVGDVVLRTIADILRTASRAEDRLLRYGGDEFVVLPVGEPDVAEAVATRIHEAVAAHPWERVAPGLRVTVSVGVGLGSSEPEQTAELLHAADRALLQAKRGGRNRVARSAA